MKSPLSLVKLMVVVLGGAPGGKGMAGRGGGAGGGGAGAGTGVGAGSGGGSSGTSTSQPVTRATRRSVASARTITAGIKMVIGRSAVAPERKRVRAAVARLIDDGRRSAGDSERPRPPGALDAGVRPDPKRNHAGTTQKLEPAGIVAF